ncbi:MAG: SelB C-terminal domain-containing protein, partial [Rhodospirillales bacterium]
FSPKRGRAKPERLALVRQLADADLVDGAIAELTATRTGFDLGLYSAGRGVSATAEEELAATLPAVSIGTGLIDEDRWTALKAEITDFLESYHQTHPDKAGAGRAELAGIGRTAGLSGPAFEAVINRLVSNRHLGRAGSAIALAGHKPKLAPADQKLWKTCGSLFREAGLRPPRVRELAEELGLDPKMTERFLNRCVGAGLVLRVSDNRYFPPSLLNRLGQIARVLDSETEGAFTVRDYKDRSEIGRNLTIELLEFFDRTGLTHRSGETRRLKRDPDELFPVDENPRSSP